MKNWKYIKVGNYDAQEKLGLKPVQGEIEKEVYSVYTQTGKDKEKTKRELKAKHPHLDEQWLDKLLSKLVGNEFVTKSSLQKALREQEQLLKDAEKMLRTKLDPEEKTEWQMEKEDAKKQIERIKEKIGNESIFKQEASMFEGLKKDAEKEIGNKAIVLKDGNVWVVLYANETKSQEFESEAEAREFAKKVGNADTVSEYNAEIQRLTKKAEQLRRMGQGRSAMEIEKQIEKLGKELSELGNKKVVNGTPGSIASIGPAWMHGGTVYGKMDTDESGKRHNEYVKITWLGEGKGGVANYFIDDRMQSDKFGSLDKNELKRWAESKIGNSTWSEPRKMPFQQKSLKYAYEKAKANGLSGKRLEEEMLRIAKTLPHESSATEEEKKKDVSEWILRNGSREDFVNNLARARNAMNKKVKNSSVREYKDSEGRIAQIDFDSDGTDADMSIYEDERMTRSVDHKNFSTIRDAEQYVQSHGFRRVG